MLERKENKYAEILMSCVEEQFFKTEAVWDYHAFMRILSGEMKIVQADASYTFQTGDTLFVPRNQLSTVIKRPALGQPYRSILITFRPERLKEYFTKRKIKHTEPASQRVRTLDKHPIIESYFASLVPYFDLQEALPEELKTLKLEEAISILRTMDHEVENLLSDFSEPGKIDLAAFMEKNFMFNMPLEKFGYLTGRSIATFNRDFRKAFHNTPQKWLTQKRLELAHYQLRENHRKPGDVYHEAGFENLSHFSFAFKKHFGYTPSDLTSNETVQRDM